MRGVIIGKLNLAKRFWNQDLMQLKTKLILVNSNRASIFSKLKEGMKRLKL
jgi:hypothetical protein